MIPDILASLFSIAVDTAPRPGTSSTNLIIAGLGSASAGAVLAAVITGIFSKRKLGAEATEIITNAAAGVVKTMQSEIDRQMKRNEELVSEHVARMNALVESHAEEMEQVRRVLQLHVAWDAIAIAKMNDIGIDMPPAPPLLPPLKMSHPTTAPLTAL